MRGGGWGFLMGGGWVEGGLSVLTIVLSSVVLVM